jgi:adenine-specific DNA methylase
MDPSCGDGRFLACAADLGASEVIGCDLDETAVAATRAALATRPGARTLRHADFFTVDPAQHPKVSIVVGNPPFIRYQSFTGESRRRALESALQLGARLTALSSSWAPFIIHAIRFLQPGGVMAMVVPAEIIQTNYGLRTLEALCRNFGRVHLITFARNFFSDSEADTYLLLAEQAGNSCSSIDLHPLESVKQLAGLELAGLATTTLPVGADDRVPFSLAFLTPEQRQAWFSVIEMSGVVRLSEVGEITNGYVTGANRFFLSTRESAVKRNLPSAWLRATAVNSASFRGLEFTDADISELESRGRAHHLLELPEESGADGHRSSLRQILKEGEALGLPARFKCRTRTPWWRVPNVHVPHVFLPYMIGRHPVASVNSAGASYTNTLHGLRLRRVSNAKAVALGLQSTLSLLSMELQGRTYGGGILKLEPSEVERVALVVPAASTGFSEVDRRIRADDHEGATALADEIVLRKELGLDQSTVRLLQAARARLVARRYSRNRKGKPS